MPISRLKELCSVTVWKLESDLVFRKKRSEMHAYVIVLKFSHVIG
jgi:hypothetical protein